MRLVEVQLVRWTDRFGVLHRYMKARQRCNGDNDNGDERDNRATEVAAMVCTTVAMAADSETTIN